MKIKSINVRDTLPRHPTRKWGRRSIAEIDTIVVHTNASDNQDPARTATYHITPSPDNHLSPAGAPAVAYHDMIAKDGTVYRCNYYHDITWNTRGWNERCVGVSLMFRGQDGLPPPSAQYNALVGHLVILCLYLKVLPKRVKGHRESPRVVFIDRRGAVRYRKVCPGMGVDLDVLRNHVTCRLQTRLSAEGLYHGKIDGLFGKKSKAALRAFDPRKSKFRRHK